MKTIYSIIATSVVLFICSCSSSMKVRVDALNMPAFKKSYLYHLDYIDKMEQYLKDILSDKYQNSLRQSTLGIVKDFIMTKDYVAIEDRTYFDSLFTYQYDSTITHLVDNANILLGATIDLKSNNDSKILQEKHEKTLSNYRVAGNAFSKMLNGFKEILIEGTQMPSEIDGILNLYNHMVSNASSVTSSAFGTSIVGDPMTPIIAALPKQYWLKYSSKINLSNNAGEITQQSLGDISKYVKNGPSRYNLTVARTWFGNSDIAFKMEHPGEFIVKGVRVDADEAVRTSFKVVSQGIKYLAYSSGIPVAGTSTSPKKALIPELDSLVEKSIKLQKQKDRCTIATEAFLGVLISVSDDVNATSPRPGQTISQMNAAKASALARIKTAYSIYETALSNSN